MENGNNGFERFLGKMVSFIIEDKGNQYPRKKTGVLRSVNDTHFVLFTENKDVAILKETVLRIELI